MVGIWVVIVVFSHIFSIFEHFQNKNPKELQSKKN